MRALFQYLDHFLTQTQPLWRFEPFHLSAHEYAPWADSHPQLQRWLDSLSESDIEPLKNSPIALYSYLDQFIEGLADARQRAQLPSSSYRLLNTETIEAGIPGRKLEQIRRLGSVAIQLHRGSEWLEWCSGKGYLGRVLANSTRQPVTSFEFQQTLCDAGQAEADALGLPMTFICGDAFEPASQGCFSPQQHAVALHACGDLHVRLLQYATQASLQAVTLSPCCYHLIQSDSYQCLSQPARASSLHLTRQELRLPLQETVTGGERVRRHRLAEMTYRLGFDQLLKAQLNMPAYLPVPSIKKSQLSEGFAAFCYWAAEQKDLILPGTDFAQFEKSGEQRFWKMEKLSLVQQGFRRLLEMWLVLDKALYLEEHGYQVSLSEFCRRETTPRNLLIHGFKR